jgi:hypothetical protein
MHPVMSTIPTQQAHIGCHLHIYALAQSDLFGDACHAACEQPLLKPKGQQLTPKPPQPHPPALTPAPRSLRGSSMAYQSS